MGKEDVLHTHTHTHTHTHINTMGYHLVVKKKKNKIIFSNMDGPRDYQTK